MKNNFFKPMNWVITLFMAFSPVSASAQICSPNDSLQLVALSRGFSNRFWNLANPVRTWRGISLTANGFVQQIDLSNAGLTGTVTALELPELEYLYLHNNSLTGAIPFFNCPKLKKLFLYLNQLTGTIPNFNLPALQHLHLHANKLSGQIPNFNLPNLTKLQLPHNQLTGTIPNFNLPNLNHLDVGRNFIGGTIPPWNCPQLDWLDVEGNLLQGPIPRFPSPIRRILVGVNQFTFGDMLPNWNAFPNAYITYIPQDSIFKDTTMIVHVGMRFSVSLEMDSTVSSNEYQWYKNNVLYGSPTHTNQLIINNVQLTDAGIYTCKVTNPNMPLLTLDSRKIKLSPTAAANLCGTFKMVPNPTQEMVQIHCGGKLGEMITIYNDIGQLMATQMATQEPMQLDLSAFQSGVYFVYWGDKTHKILKIN